MSGHSKWSTIKHKKAKTDAKRGKIFTKIGREITLAVREGGADPEMNAKLKDAIAKAKSANMPNDNIARGIKKAAGDKDGNAYEEIVYEGYGPGGVAVIVESMTDNKNRTAGEVRHAFDKCTGNLGTIGCVSFMFDKKGVIIIENEEDQIEEDNIMMDALESGAEDISTEEGYYEILTDPNEFSKVREVLEKLGYKSASADIEMLPQTSTKLTDNEQIKNMEKLIDVLEDLDDVQNIYHNWEE